MEAREVFSMVSAGQNGRMDPMMIGDAYAHRLYNVTVRDGLARTRPGLVSRGELPVQGRFQGAFEYRLESKDYWAVVVAGQLWLFVVAEETWVYIAAFPTTDFEQAYFVQADRYLIVQNGIYDPVENWPIIVHETELVDALDVQYLHEQTLKRVRDAELPEIIRVPIGTAMAFGHGRLFVAVDRYYNDGASGSPDVGWRTNLGSRFWVASNVFQIDNMQALLVFSDMYLLNHGVAFSLPTEMGFITAMTFLRNAETGTGLGALIIFARRGASAFAVNVSRERGLWLSAGFGQVLFTSSGCRSPRSVTQVNSDLVYYGDSGLRTLKYSASNESGTGGLATVSLSPEVSNATRLTDTLLHDPHVSIAHIDNYIFFTAVGRVLPDNSVAFNAILPWDLTAFQVSGENPARVFTGAWCGALYHDVLAWRGEKQTLGVIYRASATSPLRYGYFSAAQACESICSVQTKSHLFGQLTLTKRIKFIDALFDEVNGSFTVWIKWRVDGRAKWYASSPRKFVGSNSSTGLFRLLTPAENEFVGHNFQFAIEWKGQARLKLALFTAVLVDRYMGDDGICQTVTLPSGTAGDELEGFNCPTLPDGVAL